MNNIWIKMMILALLLGLTGVKVYLMKLEKDKTEKVKEKLGKGYIQAINSNANYFGIASKGVLQVKGNGVIAATRENIYYERWYNEDSINIPLEKVVTIETVKSFLGKTNFRPIVKISYFTEEGNLDSVAWAMKNHEEWIEKINKLANDLRKKSNRTD